MKQYKVLSGDTLYGISNQFGVSVSDLKKVNNLTSNTIKVGQILKVPVESGSNPDNSFSYTVKKGDTLYSIAKKYDTTVSDIVNLNNLANNNLSINQVLLIPEKYSDIKMPNYTIYEVKKGDTLYSIAKMFDITVDKIIKDNNLTSNILNIGDNLKIEGIVEECYGSDYETEYTVKKGDTLYSIAKMFNITILDIKKLNNLTSNLISIGQKLKV